MQKKSSFPPPKKHQCEKVTNCFSQFKKISLTKGAVVKSVFLKQNNLYSVELLDHSLKHQHQNSILEHPVTYAVESFREHTVFLFNKLTRSSSSFLM